MLWVYGQYKYFIAGTGFRRHNLTSLDVIIRCINTVPALKGLRKNQNMANQNRDKQNYMEFHDWQPVNIANTVTTLF